MDLSTDAQIFLIGIWTECDDQGVFEWKPGQLRARIRPTKDGDVSPLLAELEAANCIASFEHGGRQFGLVRNFRIYQRPKKPNSVHLLPAEFRTYVGLNGDGSELPETIGGDSSAPTPVKSKPFPQKGEKSPQMEDGEKDEGGRVGSVATAPSPRATGKYAFEGSTIRLNEADFDSWQARFHAIPDLAAELTGLDGWLQGQPEAKRKGWFHSVPGMLSRKHQEMLAKAAPPNETAYARSRLSHREQERFAFLEVYLRDGWWHPTQGEQPASVDEAQAELDRLKTKEAA